MNALLRNAAISGALALLCFSPACHSARGTTHGNTVLSSEHLEVRSLPPQLETDAESVLPLLHVACAPGDRLLALVVVIFDDVDGNGRRSPGEAAERFAMKSDGARAEFMEWRGMRLPPGDALRAELDATLERHGRFEGTWRVSPPDDPRESRR